MTHKSIHLKNASRIAPNVNQGDSTDNRTLSFFTPTNRHVSSRVEAFFNHFNSDGKNELPFNLLKSCKNANAKHCKNVFGDTFLDLNASEKEEMVELLIWGRQELLRIITPKVSHRMVNEAKKNMVYGGRRLVSSLQCHNKSYLLY